MNGDRPIYHITHVDNLAGILSEGRLWSDAKRVERGLDSTNIGYSHIKTRRMRRLVNVSAGGTLGQYVPFNFCPRSVMLYVVSQGHENYQGGQRHIVHLVSSVHVAVGSGRPWFFTDRHADLGYAQQLDTLDRLGDVDWTVMPRQQWGGDQEVTEKRQAEFLIHDWCPWTAIQRVGVIDADAATLVQAAIATADHRPVVEVERGWYY